MPPPRVTAIRLDVFIQQAREPAFVLGPDRRILFVNRAWEQLTGRMADAVIGLECRPHGPTRSGDLDGLGGSFCPPPEAMAGHPSVATTLILHDDGEARWRKVEYTPFHNQEGGLIGLLGLVKSVEAASIAADSEAQQLRVELMEVRQRLLERPGFDWLIGQGVAHRRLLDQVTAASSSPVPVLIVGEPGTGKKLVARTIHQRGPRKLGPILPFDCRALSPEILERELFGIGAGSRVGAGMTNRLIRAPEGATLILQDLLELPRDLQASLVNALGPQFRLIATTTADPEQVWKSGRLRDDFYYAITPLVIRLSPLRERLEEIPLLAQHFLERANLRHDRPRDGFTPEALDALKSYDWPGNLRELAHVVIDEAHPQGDEPLISLEAIPASIRGARGGAYLPSASPVRPLTLKERLIEVEKRLIEKALQQSGDNKSKAAKLLGVNRPFLYRRLKELGIADEPDPGEETPL